MGRVAVGRLVISAVGVALKPELGSSPHPSLPFSPYRPTLLKHNRSTVKVSQITMPGVLGLSVLTNILDSDNDSSALGKRLTGGSLKCSK